MYKKTSADGLLLYCLRFRRGMLSQKIYANISSHTEPPSLQFLDFLRKKLFQIFYHFHQDMMDKSSVRNYIFNTRFIRYDFKKHTVVPSFVTWKLDRMQSSLWRGILAH